MQKVAHQVARSTIGVLALTLSAVMAWSAGAVWADEPDTESLKAEIEMLKERLASLESKVSSGSAVSAGGSAVTVPSGVTGIEISGFVDTAYSYNFNEPQDGVNDGRIFDVQPNSFVIHNAQLNIAKGVDEYSPYGFGVALMFGDDAEVTTSTGFTSDEVDIQQAYVEYLADFGEGLDLTLGKQATLIGAEVIESKDNWNHSRSYMFGLAIPFTHTGIRASYPLSETVTGTVGVNNGWSVVDDDNIGKGIEGQLAWEDGPAFVSVTSMWSPEASPTTDGATPPVPINTDADRWILDLVATYQATDDLAFMLNYDYGHDEDSAALGDDATWQGLAAYVNYAVNDTCSLAGRYEIFRDYDGSKLPTLSVASAGDTTFQEITLTGQHLFNEHLIGRLEYRHDWANSHVFGHDDGGFQNYQDTISAEVIMPF